MRKLLITLIALAISLPAWPGDHRSTITTVVENVSFPEGVAVTSQEFIFISMFNHGGYIVRGNGQGAAAAVVGTGLDTGSIDGEGGDPRDDLGDGGPATQASIRDAFDVAVDEAGNIFIADTENNRVRRVDVATGIIETVAGTGVAGSGGDGGLATQAQLNAPMRLIVSPAGDLLVTERNGGRVRRIDGGTQIITTVAGGGSGSSCHADGIPATSFCLGIPIGVTLDAAGNLYVAERSGSVHRVDAVSGRIFRVAGSPSATYVYNGDCRDARTAFMPLIGDVESDADGNLYVTYEYGIPNDSTGHRVLRVDAATGVITTIAGTGIRTGSIDGEGGDHRDDLGDGGSSRLASVANPSGLALGPDGSLYLADRNNNRIRRIELRSDARPFAPIVGLEPGVLWPPNHRLAEVRATASAGVCATGELVLSSVTSSEPDDAPGTGDGATLDDIQSADFGLPDDLLLLRAERGGASGRTYTMTYELAGSGGQLTAVGTVFVPWSRGASAEPLVLQAESTPAGTLLTWAEVPGAFFYDVARGRLGDVRVSGSAVHLGDLACVGSRLTTPSTIGREDPEQPALGEAFYYVAEYDDGWRTGYGTEETPLPRLATGGCP